MNKYIAALARYAVDKELIKEEERIYSINLLLDVLKLDEYEEPENKEETKALSGNLEAILGKPVASRINAKEIIEETNNIK